MTKAISTTETMTKARACELTEKVKNDAAALWEDLLELYEGGAHLALGYSSWGAYFKTEFGKSKSHAYRMLEAAQVMRSLPQSPIGDSVENEGTARELVDVEPDARPAVLEAAQVNGKPATASGIRAVLDRVLPLKTVKEKKPPKEGGRPKKTKITVDQVKEATRKLRSGKEIITPALRKSAQNLFGKLVRTLDRMTIYDQVKPQMNEVLAAIKAAK